MTDDVTGAEPKVVSASFADPYVQLIRDDASVMVLKADESGDLDEVEMGDALLGSKWLSGSLYEDSNDTFRLEWGDDSDDEVGNVLMFLLGAGGGLQVGQTFHQQLLVHDLSNRELTYCRYFAFLSYNSLSMLQMGLVFCLLFYLQNSLSVVRPLERL